MGLRRGDIVTVALQGEQGKPRPALVIQPDRFGDLASVTVLPLTGTLVDAPAVRIGIDPDARNGLTKRSQAMVDKVQTPPRSKIGSVIGHLDPSTLEAVGRALAIFLGLA